MATPEQIERVAKTGTYAIERLESYLNFARATLAKYEDRSNGGTVSRPAAYLRHDIGAIETATAYTFEFESLGGHRLTPAQVQGLERQRALFEDVSAFYDESGDHVGTLREELSGEHELNKTETERIERAPGVITRALSAFYVALDEALGAESDQTDREEGLFGFLRKRRDDGAKPPGDDTMSNGKDDHAAALNGIIDAISRLQGQGGAFGGIGYGAGNVFSVFDRQLDQKLMQRGFPDPKSETSLAATSAGLTAKLLDTLDRTIVTGDVGGVSTYTFNPLKARGAIIGGDGTALGAQAVAAETIRNLKGPIMTNVNSLVSESVVGEQDEVYDLKEAIDDGLERLIGEASSERGVFVAWLEEIIDTIFRDLMSLADLYDIRDPRKKKRLGPITESLTDLVGLSPDAVLDKLSIDPHPNRLLAEPDIGILTAEANDRALLSIISQLLLIYYLVHPDGELGPILGRVRALNDTISASVLAAETALAAAGVSEGDRIVTFVGDGIGNIDLERLLGWIKSESITARPFLYREDLNVSDLRRLKAARATQHTALQKFMAEHFPTVTPNAFSLGRRQLEEVRQHLCRIVDLIDTLIGDARRGGYKGADAEAAES